MVKLVEKLTGSIDEQFPFGFSNVVYYCYFILTKQFSFFYCYELADALLFSRTKYPRAMS